MQRRYEEVGIGGAAWRLELECSGGMGEYGGNWILDMEEYGVGATAVDCVRLLVVQVVI